MDRRNELRLIDYAVVRNRDIPSRQDAITWFRNESR